jgi:putative acetyltransferase
MTGDLHLTRCRSHVEIRLERRADHEAVDAVHLAAFGEHGQRVVALLHDLRALSGAVSLVAELDAEVAGHVLFSYGWVDAPARLVDVAVLSPVAVLPQRQRRGVASALIRHGLHLLDSQAMPAVFLEGPPSFYGRLGFEPAVAAGFRTPSLRIPGDAFQVMRMAAYEPWMTGTFVYRDVFWRHDVVGLRD